MSERTRLTAAEAHKLAVALASVAVNLGLIRGAVIYPAGSADIGETVQRDFTPCPPQSLS